MKIRAPGKLILSGEHAVVYGAPALAMTVNRYVTATAIQQAMPLISFDFSDLAYKNGLTLTALRHLRARIHQQYEHFREGKCRIRDVLKKSHELAQFVFTFFLEGVKRRRIEGVRIHLQSDIPVGCGMGSSAATILGVSHALAHFLQMEASPEFFLQMGLEAENMQHGHSSGLDLRICLQGGCVLARQGVLQARDISTLPFYLVNTGLPLTTTGECVSQVAPLFRDAGLIAEFAAVTERFDAAFSRHDFSAVRDCISENAVLLMRIGVVPKRVQQFIRDIENFQGGAKICGAGAVMGDRAGMVLVATDQPDALMDLSARYQYSVQPVTGEARGVHVVQ